MKAVIAVLNAAIQGEGVVGSFSMSDARLALHAIESQGLAINALRLLVEECKGMNDVGAPFYAALDHAEKLLKLHDAITLKHSVRDVRDVVVELPPKPADSPAAKKPVANQDVSDLV